MDIASLIKTIVTPLVAHPEAVRVERHETDDYMAFDLSVDPEDIGRVIGKGGRIAQSIRTIIYAVKSPYDKRVRLNIVDAPQTEA